uniref:glycoside hydrolase family 19 protein n=1 Tax=Parerythrobacter lutipelagi TaxID=1964208 RepID=UPI0010F6FB02|nr:glycoside hydrolase family 19 protein [Parerythrobacter lutipelagi]
MAPLDRTAFYDKARTAPFGRLHQSQVDGTNAVLDYWDGAHSGEDRRWLAYVLATAYHETAFTMQPIGEYGGDHYFNTRYGPQTRVGRVLGNTKEGDGARYKGRGYVQLTGRRNYTDWGKRLDIDLVGHPDLALKDDVAAKILIDGSILGTFTGRKLGDYLSGSASDWIHARRIINGTDRAERIAGYARQFYDAVTPDRAETVRAFAA